MTRGLGMKKGIAMDQTPIPDLSKLCTTKADWREAAEQLQRRNHQLQELNHLLATELAQARLNTGRA